MWHKSTRDSKIDCIRIIGISVELQMVELNENKILRKHFSLTFTPTNKAILIVRRLMMAAINQPEIGKGSILEYVAFRSGQLR